MSFNLRVVLCFIHVVRVTYVRQIDCKCRPKFYDSVLCTSPFKSCKIYTYVNLRNIYFWYTTISKVKDVQIFANLFDALYIGLYSLLRIRSFIFVKNLWRKLLKTLLTADIIYWVYIFSNSFPTLLLIPWKYKPSTWQ